MSQDLVQAYYDFLTRIDHPVFAKDFRPIDTIDKDAPLNSILNLIGAREFARMHETVEEMRLNSYPISVTATTIDDWELEYFGFTKAQLSIEQRVTELMIKFNQRFHMGVPDVEALAEAITGQTPQITRNLFYGGWTLGAGTLGSSTTLGGDQSQSNKYLVEFTQPVDSTLLAKLDQQLTAIEKAGSTHKTRAPLQRWVLGKTALGLNTTL